MRDANMLDVSVSYKDEEADRVEYLAMIAERLVNTTDSTYSCENPEINLYREVHHVLSSKDDATAAHVVRKTHRNGRRRVKFEAAALAKVAKGKGKGKDEEHVSFLTTRHFRQWQQFRKKPDVLPGGRRPPNGEDFPSEEGK
jgi:hypothetical protein